MSNLEVVVDDGVAVVTFDRPPVNAIDRASMDELRRIFSAFEADRSVRVAIFTSAGTRAFIAGVDLSTVGERDEDVPPGEMIDPGRPARDAMWAITDCAVPVIAAVNGPAIGAGLAFAACCDIIVASDTATFGTTEINVGLLGASAHVSSLVGRHKAREMFFTGELVPAADLHRIGAVRAVVPADELLPTARALAATLAAKSPIAMRMAKASMNQVEGLPLKEAYRVEQTWTDRLVRFEDSAEAREAFFAKRDPEWRWR
ncbi:MAG: enoyl-CoA hydratase-related protein [Acidimicrobiales bacterium]|jgi:enoyl-CoA hydratase|nr:enoyl-CoA hydratase-related protein [Acidimicrobiales bacterium]